MPSTGFARRLLLPSDVLQTGILVERYPIIDNRLMCLADFLRKIVGPLIDKLPKV